MAQKKGHITNLCHILLSVAGGCLVIALVVWTLIAIPLAPSESWWFFLVTSLLSLMLVGFPSFAALLVVLAGCIWLGFYVSRKFGRHLKSETFPLTITMVCVLLAILTSVLILFFGADINAARFMGAMVLTILLGGACAVAFLSGVLPGRCIICGEKPKLYCAPCHRGYCTNHGIEYGQILSAAVNCALCKSRLSSEEYQ